MGYVFISHSTADKAAAQEICGQLTRLGVDYWIAPQSIPAGERYAIAIDKAIQSCAIFLLLFSKSSDASDAVMSEIELATNQKKKVVSLRLEPIEPVNLRFYLGTRQWMDWPVEDEQLRKLFHPAKSVEPRLLQDSARTPEQKSVLPGSRMKWVKTCLASLVLALICSVIATKNPALESIFFSAFFGLFIVAIVCLVRTTLPGYLRFTPEGFVKKGLIGSSSYDWASVSDFRTLVRGLPIVIFNWRRVDGKVIHKRMLSTYQTTSPELAQQLNIWRTRYR